LELLVSLAGALPWAVIGWPVVVVAIVTFGVAFSTSRAWVGFAGVLIAAPLCLYLTEMPYLYWVSRAALAANFLSVAAMWRRRPDIAFAMLLPFMIMIALVVILWLRNFSVFRGFEF
jgi:uncharacterized membrane protein YfcA